MPQPHFTPGKDLVPILQEAGWAPGPVWTGRKSRPHRDTISDHPACSQSLYWLSHLAHTWISKPVNQTKYQRSMCFLYEQYKFPPTCKWCVHTRGGRHKCISSAVYLCSHLTGRVYGSKMQVQYFYICSNKNVHKLGNAHINSEVWWDVTSWTLLKHNSSDAVLHFPLFTTVHTLQNYWGLLPHLSEKNSSLYGYVDFTSVIFISHTWPQNFNVLKYFVVCDLKTIFHTHS